MHVSLSCLLYRHARQLDRAPPSSSPLPLLCYLAASLAALSSMMCSINALICASSPSNCASAQISTMFAGSIATPKRARRCTVKSASCLELIASMLAWSVSMVTFSPRASLTSSRNRAMSSSLAAAAMLTVR
eukprot:TRINITY_DN59_c0_g1_i4.p1 TRINITY_DN59_c0_g1~~TRINITY_DN59_c0_g1_i4.p1  ORF type:complete len:132 (-),score=9.33 TRINITY_DN59_c0_g1_i4:196-591(-)